MLSFPLVLGLRFYVTDILESPSFEGIPGFDFIPKNNIVNDSFKKPIHVNNDFSITLVTRENQISQHDIDECNTQCSIPTNQDMFLTCKLNWVPKSRKWISVYRDKINNDKNYLFEYNLPLKVLLGLDAIIQTNKNDNSKRKKVTKMSLFFNLC